MQQYEKRIKHKINFFMNILNTLNDLLDLLAVDAVLPASNTQIKIRPLSVKQIKDVVDKSISIPHFNIGFKQAIESVLLQNIKTENVYTLTEVDVRILYFYLKGVGTYRDINTTSLFEHIQQHSLPSSTCTILKHDTQIELQVPTTIKSTQIDEYILSKIVTSKDVITNNEFISSLMFSAEILKYVNTITIQGVNILQDIKDVEQQIQIIEQLPIVFANEVALFIQQIETFIQEATTLDNVAFPFDITYLE